MICIAVRINRMVLCIRFYGFELIISEPDRYYRNYPLDQTTSHGRPEGNFLIDQATARIKEGIVDHVVYQWRQRHEEGKSNNED